MGNQPVFLEDAPDKGTQTPLSMACPCPGPPVALLAPLQAGPLPPIIHPHRINKHPSGPTMEIGCDFHGPSTLEHSSTPSASDPINRRKMTLGPHLELKRKFISDTEFYCECHSINVNGYFQVS